MPPSQVRRVWHGRLNFRPMIFPTCQMEKGCLPQSSLGTAFSRMRSHTNQSRRPFARACIFSTARGPLARGYEVAVIADAVVCRPDRGRKRLGPSESLGCRADDLSVGHKFHRLGHTRRRATHEDWSFCAFFGGRGGLEPPTFGFMEIYFDHAPRNSLVNADQSGLFYLLDVARSLTPRG